MDGFNPPSWPPDNQDSTTPGAETADYEYGRSTAFDDRQQQIAVSWLLNQPPMDMMTEAYNQRQFGDIAPSDLWFNQPITPWDDHAPHFSNNFGSAHGNTGMQGGFNQYTDGYASPTFASPTGLRANSPFYPVSRMVPNQSTNLNPLLNTSQTQSAFTRQGSSFYPDYSMTPNQPAVFNPPFNTSQTQSAFTRQGRSSDYPKSRMAPSQPIIFNPSFNIFPTRVAKKKQGRSSDYPKSRMAPSQSAIFSPQLQMPSTVNGQDPGSSGNEGVDFCDKLNFTSYPMLDSYELWTRNQAFYKSSNTDGFKDNHHSNQIATSDDYGNSKSLSGLPLNVQIMIWKASFSAGRAVFIDYAVRPDQINPEDRRTGLPITLAICKVSRQVTEEHYTIVERHYNGSGRAVYMKPFCFNPEVDTLCITYNFTKPPHGLKKDRKVWYDEVDKALRKEGVLKDVGLKGVRSLDVRDVVAISPVDASNISWFLPHGYNNSFLSRFKNLDRLVFTSACAIDNRLSLDPRRRTLGSIEKCESFWMACAKYLENQRDLHKGKLIAKEKIIVRQYETLQGLSALERLGTMDWLF
ncbi:hypothetical protein EAE96_010634 [Botrytis aclada]|nr:hypothetical protein EAE96_010634 [Botrytis aclada]